MPVKKGRSCKRLPERKTGSGHPKIKVFTEELREQFIALVADGAPPELARKMLCINKTTYRHWEMQAESEIDPYFSFFIDVDSAEATSTYQMITQFKTHLAESSRAWIGSMTWLERRMPNSFARPEARTRHTHQLEMSPFACSDALLEIEKTVAEVCPARAIEYNPPMIDVEFVEEKTEN